MQYCMFSWISLVDILLVTYTDEIKKCFQLCNTFYYMEESVLLGTEPLVDSICNFHLRPEWRIFRMSPL